MDKMRTVLSRCRARFGRASESSVQRKPSVAFSLIELLVVMAIMAILLSLSGAAISRVAVGSKLNRAGLMVADQIALAQQEAVTRNREMEVRIFYMTQGVAPGWKGIQFVRIEEDGSQTAVSKMAVISEEICISADSALSPLLMSSNAIQGTANTPANGNLSYRAFRFRPTGSASSSLGSNNFLTLQHQTAKGSPPPNFYTVQVNPVTGKVTSYRP